MESKSHAPLCPNDRISDWQKSCGFPTPPDNNLKRERSRSLPMDDQASDSRSGSPKRRRMEDSDDIQPGQSASQLATALTLNTKNTFSATASRTTSKRSGSPTRETKALLITACPPIITESIREAPPSHVNDLGDRLAKGIEFGFIPRGLMDLIKNDTELDYQVTKSADFDDGDAHSAAELLELWNAVKNIFINARDCMDGSRDENAWCDDVVRPLIRLAMKLYGKNKWWLQSVQSQPIDPDYLSTIPAPTPGDPNRRKAVDRKTDYLLSYSHRNPVISDLYKRLRAAGNSEIGYTVDTFTKRTATFSGFEVKAATGDKMEAELQMSVGIAASLLKKQELARTARVSFEPAAMAEPAITIVGHEHFVYYAYPLHTLASGGVHVLGPDVDRFVQLTTGSIRGIFRLLQLYRNMLEYGMDEGDDGYWGQFLGPVLETLASS